MDRDEISWQDVLFEGFEVLITAAAHSASGLMVWLAGRSSEGVCQPCGRVSARVHRTGAGMAETHELLEFAAYVEQAAKPPRTPVPKNGCTSRCATRTSVITTMKTPITAQPTALIYRAVQGI